MVGGYYKLKGFLPLSQPFRWCSLNVTKHDFPDGSFNWDCPAAGLVGYADGGRQWKGHNTQSAWFVGCVSLHWPPNPAPSFTSRGRRHWKHSVRLDPLVSERTHSASRVRWRAIGYVDDAFGVLQGSVLRLLLFVLDTAPLFERPWSTLVHTALYKLSSIIIIIILIYT